MRRQRRSPTPAFPPGVALIPEDFSARLTALKEMTGLSWEGMAVGLGVDSRAVAAVAPGGGAQRWGDVVARAAGPSRARRPWRAAE